MKKLIELQFEVTPEELANAFWDMNGIEQAQFFNHLGGITVGHRDYQLYCISTAPNLTEEGRSVMRSIGDYSQKQEPVG
jgi:hypothetical protein